MKSLVTAAAAAAMVMAACSQSQPPVPRRTAYPRIEPYSDSVVTAAVGPVGFSIRAEADTAVQRPGWLDISYPRYNAITMLTVRRFGSRAELDAALANRMQRISLNLGDRTAASEEFTNGAGFICRLIVSLDGGPTPVQMIACDTAAHILISGASVIDGPAEPADSVAPAVDALAADARKILKTAHTL